MFVKVGTLLAVAAVALGSLPPSLVSSFPAPAGVVDVALAGPSLTTLYALTDGTPPRLYTVAIPSGTVSATLNLPLASGVRGLGWDEFTHAAFWVLGSGHTIYRLTSAGSLSGSFDFGPGEGVNLGYAPTLHTPYSSGLYVSRSAANLFYQLNATTGSVGPSYAGPAAAVRDYDEYCALDDNTDCIYWWQYSGGPWQTIATLPAKPLGLGATTSWSTDDPNVYLAVAAANGYVYNFFGANAITPASLGRVKTLYK
jgi:hypothetical protein